MEFSKEQNDIFDYAEHGILNLIVQAVAGAGKTTTLIECANRLDENKTVLLLAHNKSTRDTLREKIGDKPNVKVYTLHGLAWRMFNEHFGFSPEIDEDKYRKYINANIDTIASEEYNALSRPSKLAYKSNVMDLINKSRYNLKQSEKEIKKLATKKYGMTLIADECKMVSDVLKWGATQDKVVDFQDLLWFPSEFGYFTKKYLADIIMLDEAQDASIAQQDIVSRCFKRNTRLFSFGDKEQCINGWAGSDTSAFEHLKDSSMFRRDSVELPLTTNYRCGKRIIEYAKRFTNNNIHAMDGAVDGAVRENVLLSEVNEGDMVLCRNIAPLMEVYRRFVSLGKKVYFRGEELGRKLKESADCSDGETIDEMISSMKKRLIFTWDMLSSDEGVDKRETMTHPMVISQLDTIKSMESLPRTVKTRLDLEMFVDDMFSDEGQEGIQLSTIHRAKGLESDKVFIICPSLIPSHLATLDWELEEERHLQYVMCTRPKYELNFVSESEISPNMAFSEVNLLYNELENIRKEIDK